MSDSETGFRGRVTVYSIQGCPHCLQAKATLKNMGLPVLEVDLGRHPQLRSKVKEMTGRSTVPQIFFNNLHVGGNDDLQKLPAEKMKFLVDLVREDCPAGFTAPTPEDESAEPSGESDGDFQCEKDELADLVQDLKHASVIGSRRRALTLHRKCFSANELLAWLQEEKSLAEDQAVTAAQGLLQKKYLVLVHGQQDGGFQASSEVLYRLLEDDPHSALNAGQTAACHPIAASELSLLLREMILKLFSDHLSADGKYVDYKGMKVDPAFERYSDLAVQLQRVELLSLSREETLAFFINIYNALVIHGYLRLGAPTNMWQRYRFFNYVSYLIGGEVFTLQDIENGVLRGNRKGIAQLRKPFSKSDPRLQMALPDAEPLIHFALNCGAKGCPPIKTYTPQDIDSQLLTAAEAFLENDDACLVDSGKKEVRLSQIFKWYKADFGGTDEKLLSWVLDHMGDSPKKTSLKGVLSAGKTKVSFLPYDWSSNSSH